MQNNRYNPLDNRRLRENAPRATYTVGYVTELHHEIARLVLLGQKNVDIAKKLNCSPQTVSNVRNSPIIKHRIRQLSLERDRRAVDMAVSINNRVEKAFEVIDEALYASSDEVALSIRLREANAILDRKERLDGIGQRSFHVHAHLTPEDIQELQRRALEARMSSPQEAVDINSLPVRTVSAVEGGE